MGHTKSDAKESKPFNEATYKGLNCAKNMVLTAAYLGYDDLGQLRRFQATHCFLRHFIDFQDEQYAGFKDNFVFKLLDADEKDLQETFMFASSDPSDPSANHDSNATHNFRIAKTMWTLINESGAGGFDEEKQRQIDQQFAAKFGGKTIPSVDPEKLVWPVFNHPTDQTSLEMYNRAYELLRNFITVLYKWTSWSPDPFKHSAIAADLIPPFMRNHQDHKLPPNLNIATHLSPRSFTIRWRIKNAARDDLKAGLGPGATFPELTMAAPDPRQISRLEWMDILKRLFEFEQLKIQFQTLEFCYVQNEDDLFLNLIEGSDWYVLQDNCNLTSGVTGKLFKFTTRDLEEGEVLYQYDGVPTQLVDFVEMWDKVPVLRALEPSKPGVPTYIYIYNSLSPSFRTFYKNYQYKNSLPRTPDPISTTQKSASENTFISAYLAPAIAKGENARDPTAGPGKPNPQRFFGSRLTETKVIKECAGNPAIKEIAENTNLEVESTLASAKGEQDDEGMDTKSLLRQTQLNAALSGSGPQLGPDVALSALVLGITKSEDGLFLVKFLKTKVALYPWQVSGVVYMLLATYGYVPTNGLPKEHLNKPEVQHALESLKRLPMQGGFIADQTGMGKTIQVLYYLSWVAKYHIEPPKDKITKRNKAKLVVAPTMLV